MVVYADTRVSEKQITVVLRYDDYCTKSSTELEIKILDALQRKSVSCTFGVVPYVHGLRNALTQTKADILKKALKAGTVEVALHGFYHIRDRNAVHGEFLGLEYNRQVEKIAKGKVFLQQMLNTKITTFIPPYNLYDINTIRALEKVQFKYISGNKLGVGKQSSSLIFLPVTCELDEVRDAVESARRIHDIKPIIVVMFHDYDFFEVNKKRGKLSYQEFVDLLSWLTSQRDIRVTSFRQAITARTDLSAERYLTFRSYSKLYILIPSIVRELFQIPSGVYLSSHEASDGKRMLWPLVFVIYSTLSLISFYVSFLIGAIIFPMSKLASYVSRYGGAVLLPLLLIYEFRDEQHGLIAASGIAVLVSAYIGAWFCHLRLKKKSRLRI